MTKEDSLMMKGVAILLMLLYHLFNRADFVGMCQNELFIGNTPLVSVLVRAANPVAFFIMLSGYGLYISHTRGNYPVWRKLKLLYAHYWITLLIFVAIGSLAVGTSRYPASLWTFIGNAIGWNVSYNGEMWFLLPYAMLVVTSGYIVKISNKLNPWICIATAYAISMVSGYLIPRIAYVTIHVLLLYGTFAIAFVLGIYMAKYSLPDRILRVCVWGGKIHPDKIWIPLVLLVIARSFMPIGYVHVAYVFLFIILFVNIPKSKWLDIFLKEMGRRSTSMWFVHSYFCYHLFRNFIYSFRYPAIIFLVLLACSYTSAVFIDWLNSKVRALIT